ncbi:MAG: alpha/beta hydrolase [Candidatus Dormibacteria bacterium]|jgi:predicted alpha/beta hydrolase family esterase
MIRSVLILHGLGNHRPPEHWQFWLAQRLSERGHDVLYPALPDPDRPSLPVWMSALQKELSNMRGAERVVICHSLACLLWLKAATVLRPDERVDRLLLVSPPASKQVPDGGAEFRIDSFDAAAVRATVTGEVRIVCSDADPYNPSGAQRMYGDPLGLIADVLRGAGHITPDDGYGPWPSLDAWCDDARTRIGTNRTAPEHSRSG